MRHPTRAAIDKFNGLLGLVEEAHTQDWEIECADPYRVDEFVNCYRINAKNDDERFTLMALILGSFEEYHGLSTPNDSTWEAIKFILEEEKVLHKDHIEYYSCRETDDEEEWFPITTLIRSIAI